MTLGDRKLRVECLQPDLQGLSHWRGVLDNDPTVEAVREMLREAIYAWVQIDGHCKHYEGRLELRCVYPEVFDEDYNKGDQWEMVSYCYLMHDGRQKTYKGTPESCVSEYRADVEAYYAEVEEELRGEEGDDE